MTEFYSGPLYPRLVETPAFWKRMLDKKTTSKKAWKEYEFAELLPTDTHCGVFPDDFVILPFSSSIGAERTLPGKRDKNVLSEAISIQRQDKWGRSFLICNLFVDHA